MKTLINTRLFKPFRKAFLKTIYAEIISGNETYCCHVWSRYKFFICWKNLKEVKENMNSKYLRSNIKYTCDRIWFYSKEDRLAFLRECLIKF